MYPSASHEYDLAFVVKMKPSDVIRVTVKVVKNSKKADNQNIARETFVTPVMRIVC